MNDNVKRYHAREMPDPCPDGEYVRHDDYAKLETEYISLKAEKAKLKRQNTLMRKELQRIQNKDFNAEVG